jgi:hypothetical protein
MKEPTRDEIVKAYNALDLPLGASLEQAMEEYRYLAGKLHPDHSNSEKDRKKSEEKLKKLNNAKDTLKAHFKGVDHDSSGTCSCGASRTEHTDQSGDQQRKAGAAAQSNASGSAQEEQEACRRSAARDREAQEKATSTQSKQASSAAEQRNYQDGLKEGPQYQDDQLRWSLAIVAAVLFVGLVAFSLIGQAIRGTFETVSGWVHHDSATHYVATTPVETQAQLEIRRMHQQEQDRRSTDQMNLQIDIQKLNQRIDTDQITIRNMNRDIAEYQAQADNVDISIQDRNKSSSMVNYKRKYLIDAQNDLADAQEELAGLREKRDAHAANERPVRTYM